MLAASSSELSKDRDEWVKVPVIVGERSFDDERQAELYEIFHRGNEQLRQRTAEWQQTVRHMRDNFIRLYPVDADHPATNAAGDVVLSLIHISEPTRPY